MLNIFFETLSNEAAGVTLCVRLNLPYLESSNSDSLCNLFSSKTIYTPDYCLTKCLYAKSCNPTGWIVRCGPSLHFRIDDPDRLYGF